MPGPYRDRMLFPNLPWFRLDSSGASVHVRTYHELLRRKARMPAAIQLFASSVPLMCSPDQALLADLRARIERIGGGSGTGRLQGAWPLGLTAIDAVLPGGGLPSAQLYEIVAADAGASATGFSAVLLARLAGEGSVIWCRRDPGLHGMKLYGSGLAAFGLDLRRLLLIRVRREIDVLWAMEEGLRSGAVSGGTRRGRHSPADRIAPIAAGGGDRRRNRPAATAAGRGSGPWWGRHLVGGWHPYRPPPSRRAGPSSPAGRGLG